MKYDEIATFEDLKIARCVWTVVSNLNKRWSVFWGGGHGLNVKVHTQWW
jgi:hypothetical protein